MFFCVLGALSPYPFGVKEGPKLNFLEYVPFGRFSLSMYPLDHVFSYSLYFTRTLAGPHTYLAQSNVAKGLLSWFRSHGFFERRFRGD